MQPNPITFFSFKTCTLLNVPFLSQIKNIVANDPQSVLPNQTGNYCDKFTRRRIFKPTKMVNGDPFEAIFQRLQMKKSFQQQKNLQYLRAILQLN